MCLACLSVFCGVELPAGIGPMMLGKESLISAQLRYLVLSEVSSGGCRTEEPKLGRPKAASGLQSPVPFRPVTRSLVRFVWAGLRRAGKADSCGPFQAACFDPIRTSVVVRSEFIMIASA